jgi:hypothetical protein
MKITPLLLSLAVLPAVFITSCVDPMYGVGGGYSSYGTGPRGVYAGGYQTYTTLPMGYSGSAYLYNGRYYSGGRYQTGTYRHRGQVYSNRYYHSGQYLYGGSHQHHPGSSHSSHPSQQYRSSGYGPGRYQPYQRSGRLIQPSYLYRS